MLEKGEGSPSAVGVKISLVKDRETSYQILSKSDVCTTASNGNNGKS